MASRELRLLKLEADALRRELSEWRDRANLPRVEEPVRSEAFSMVLSGEVEILTSIPGMDEEEEGEGLGDNEDDMPVRAMPPSVACSIPEDTEDLSSMGVSTVKPPTNPFPQSFLPQHSDTPDLAHIYPRPVSHARPIIAQNMSNVSFENPAMASLYDQQTHIPSQQYQMQFNAGAPLDTDKSVSWNNEIFAAQQFRQQLPGQHNMFTPPSASQGPPNSAAQQFAHQAYYQGPTPLQHPAQHVYGSPVDSEDASSVGSGPGYGGSDRSGSDSAYGSPQDTRASSVSSQPRNYEMSGILTSNGIPARMSTGGVMWNRSDMDSVVALKPNMASAPIASGAGIRNGVGIPMIM